MRSPSLDTPCAQGGYLGIQLDAQGRVAEGSIGNVGVLTRQGVLVTPPFEAVLAGTTVKRLWELAGDTLVKEGTDFFDSVHSPRPRPSVDRPVGSLTPYPTTSGLIAGVAFAHLTPEDLFTAKEAFSLGGGGVIPIVSIDEKMVGEGRPGPVFAALDALQAQDMAGNERMLDDPPYGHYRPHWLRDLLWKRLKKVVGKMDVDTLVFVCHMLVVAYGAGRLRGQRIYI